MVYRTLGDGMVLQMPENLPNYIPDYLIRSADALMQLQLQPRIAEALATPPPGGFTLEQQWNRLLIWMRDHSTAVYTVAGLTVAAALLLPRARGRR